MGAGTGQLPSNFPAWSSMTDSPNRLLGDHGINEWSKERWPSENHPEWTPKDTLIMLTTQSCLENADPCITGYRTGQAPSLRQPVSLHAETVLFHDKNSSLEMREPSCVWVFQTVSRFLSDVLVYGIVENIALSWSLLPLSFIQLLLIINVYQILLTCNGIQLSIGIDLASVQWAHCK